MIIKETIINALLGAVGQSTVAYIEMGETKFTCQGLLSIADNKAIIALSDFDNFMQETMIKDMNLEIDLNSDELKISMFNDATEDEYGFIFETKEMLVKIVLTR